ncbi:hypothetical protein [Mesomycoplasma lagogenitalium]|uniref:Uncharacterized protein n=1 Tax=Mesomycoplasma lagogenitalium TaxID=171286 RepID=A0ABY8LV02_9BACT|nr:hypothetical protein [Mesomycoplasma lagogenitalium]WGI36358.1 hypothetical protein QEG99_02665 [Mesomycoplasma lagogenitalium]
MENPNNQTIDDKNANKNNQLDKSENNLNNKKMTIQKMSYEILF